MRKPTIDGKDRGCSAGATPWFRTLSSIHLGPEVIGNELAEFLVGDGAVEEFAIAMTQRDQGIEKCWIETMTIVLESVSSRLSS